MVLHFEHPRNFIVTAILLTLITRSQSFLQKILPLLTNEVFKNSEVQERA